MSGEDRLNWYRWTTFLIFTRRTLVLRWIVLGLIGGVSLSMAAFITLSDGELPETSIVLAATLTACWLGSRYLTGRGLRGQSLRRVWMLAAAWDGAAWALALLIRSWATPDRWTFSTPYPAIWYDEARTWRLLSSIAGTGVVGAIAGAFAGWTTLRLARLTPTHAERRAIKSALTVSLAPQLLLGGAVALLCVLDWIQPSWW